MIAPEISRYWRIAAASLSLCVLFPASVAGQATTPPSTNTSVFSNPRAGNDDPRVGLKGGLYDAGEAASGLQKIATLPKPAGFAPGDTAGPPPAPPTGPDGQPIPGPPPAQYGSTNSDLAFAGNHLFVGNYNGINFYDIDNPMQIKLRTSVLCPGGQGDVSVYGHLLFMSAEAMNGRIDCGVQGIPLPPGYTPPPMPPAPPAAPGAEAPRVRVPAASPGRPLRGVRIFDISDLQISKQVAAVQSCRGSTPTAAGRSQRQGQRLYLHLRHRKCSPIGRIGRLHGRNLRTIRARRCSASISSRSPGAPGAGEDRFQSAHLHRRAPEP